MVCISEVPLPRARSTSKRRKREGYGKDPLVNKDHFLPLDDIGKIRFILMCYLHTSKCKRFDHKTHKTCNFSQNAKWLGIQQVLEQQEIQKRNQSFQIRNIGNHFGLSGGSSKWPLCRLAIPERTRQKRG